MLVWITVLLATVTMSWYVTLELCDLETQCPEVYSTK